MIELEGASILYGRVVAKGDRQRKVIITAMYCLCGLRFKVVWIVRNRSDGGNWRSVMRFRERWSRGEGMISIQSASMNWFAF
ncbi:hypothetical protein OAA19_00340 [Rubripirellula sp.]|nr:hypothetical protein [Rubripirellula sp.]MDB4338535.1 hypothetical protein [Rubripirellula sp.]